MKRQQFYGRHTFSCIPQEILILLESVLLLHYIVLCYNILYYIISYYIILYYIILYFYHNLNNFITLIYIKNYKVK